MEMGYLFKTPRRSWLRPDVSVTHPDQAGEDFYEGAPLIAFEIVSPSDRAPDLDRKVRVYLANGGAEVFLIYPETRHAVVYRASGEIVDTRTIESPLLPGIQIPLDDILK
jgi:Uma2 family endonuclease